MHFEIKMVDIGEEVLTVKGYDSDRQKYALPEFILGYNTDMGIMFISYLML